MVVDPDAIFNFSEHVEEISALLITKNKKKKMTNKQHAEVLIKLMLVVYVLISEKEKLQDRQRASITKLTQGAHWQESASVPLAKSELEVCYGQLLKVKKDIDARVFQVKYAMGTSDKDYTLTKTPVMIGRNFSQECMPEDKRFGSVSSVFMIVLLHQPRMKG